MSISSQIIEVINDLCAKFGIAIDWTAANVVPYLEELAGKYISWEIATSWMWIWIGVLLLVIGIVLMEVEIKTACSAGFLFVVVFFLLMGGIGIIGAQVYDILTCVHFPEKQVFEYVQTWMQTTRR